MTNSTPPSGTTPQVGPDALDEHENPIGLGQASTPVRYDDFGFKVISSEQIDVTFQVSMKPGTQAECTIDALAESYAQVGTVDVVVGPSDQLEGRYTVSVATSELATTGIVESCRALP